MSIDHSGRYQGGLWYGYGGDTGYNTVNGQDNRCVAMPVR